MATSQDTDDGTTFEEQAHQDPYDLMSTEDMEHVADTFEILPIDATKRDEINSGMSWSEKNIGGGGILTVTDYGHHREECDTLEDFVELVREKIRDGIGSQYLKVMDDDKEEVAETLIAVTRSDGYVVVPYFEDVDGE